MKKEIKFTFESEKEGIRLSSSINKTTGYKTLYTQCYLNVSAEKAYDFFANTTIAFDLNKNIKSYHLVSNLDENTAYFYNHAKGILVVKDREFIIVFHRTQLPDGRFMTVSYTRSHPQYPPNKKVIRGEINIACYLFTPISDKSCKWELISDGNPKGSIPAMVVNKLMSRQLDSMVSMKRYLETKF
jgi:hypothetical protein